MKKIFKVLKNILLIVFVVMNLILIGNDIVKSVQYSKFYNQDTQIVIQDHINKNTDSITLIEEGETDIKFKNLMLNGSSILGKIVSSEDTKININSKVNLGDLKIVLLDKNNNIVFEESTEVTQSEVVLQAGTYRIVIIGKWFNGSIELESDTADIFNLGGK